MAKSMNLKMNINKLRQKVGSYIVEAALTLPVLIISVCAIILIVRIIALCETAVFTTTDKMIDSSLEIYNLLNGVSLCSQLEDELDEYCDFKVTRFSFRNQIEGITDIVSMEADCVFQVQNPIGIDAKVIFEEKIRARSFTGSEQPHNPLSEAEFTDGKGSSRVYIFPAYGIRFHRKNCRYVRENIDERTDILEMEKEDASRKGYTPCNVCGGAAYA